MATKKHDTVKLTTTVTKAKYKAEFKLIHANGDKVMLAVECAGESMTLGELDMQAAVKSVDYFKELQTFAVKERNTENLMFIAAVEKKFSRKKIILVFVNPDAKM